MPFKDPVAKAAYQRAYKERTRTSQRESRRMYDRAKHANQRAARYGCEGVLTTAEVRGVMAAARCFYCGATERLGIDHVVGLADGGLNRPENLVCCCHSCNASKWRGDQPGRWSRSRDACIDCHSDERRHLAGGLCTQCHRRRRTEADRGKPRRPSTERDRAMSAARSRRKRAKERLARNGC